MKCEQHITNIPILPEAFLTFVSKSSIGPSYAAYGPYTPCALHAMKWRHCITGPGECATNHMMHRLEKFRTLKTKEKENQSNTLLRRGLINSPWWLLVCLWSGGISSFYRRWGRLALNLLQNTAPHKSGLEIIIRPSTNLPGYLAQIIICALFLVIIRSCI